MELRLVGFHYSLVSALVVILVGQCSCEIGYRTVLGKEAVKCLGSSRVAFG